ncbi:LysM peptidoglycan-binding domain-containing protein [Streptomyces phaeochromogenes]
MKRGESLASIARRYRVKGGWKALYKLNRKMVGEDPGQLNSGTMLKLPKGAGPGRLVTPVLPPVTSPAVPPAVPPEDAATGSPSLPGVSDSEVRETQEVLQSPQARSASTPLPVRMGPPLLRQPSPPFPPSP